MRAPLFTDTLQIGFVVRDIDATIRTMEDRYGIGPWRIVEYGEGEAEDTVIHDRPATFAIRLAFAEVGRLQWELIQPLDDRSQYAEFLAERGEGIHHLQLAVDDYDDAVAELRGRGHSVLIGGTFSGHELVYLSTDRDIGVITEIVKRGGADDVPAGDHQPPANEEQQ